ncbi:hypothetical protein RASY3_09190 [Ruminococcus albus SY3]|uniref:Uncharacterized protein n=1 Tax=Ruminococcus albus SY3 TaxID=1341156 RepID=A0A011V462_RUMAL|nr:hypothetical protein [Ruminococcus albus]EXM40267.1 hypothetical protein RASY3_09190 [Ruminococcus albus SY3]
MNTSIAKKRISQVLRIDSIDSTDGDFLATHVPFRKIVVSTKSGDQFEETYKSEEDIYREIFNNELTRNEHQFVIVEGSSGAGKSHFIRWLYAMLSTKEEKDDVVLLIRRSDNTLKGTIRQLLEIKEVKEISNKEAYERLVKANQAITEAKFKSTIYHQFIVEIENDTSEVLGNIKRKKLIALLNNSTFQERLMEAGGPIDRIYSKITSSSSNVDLDLIAQFSKADLTLDVDFIDQLEYADRKAQDFANSLMEGNDEFIEKITLYMNSFVETVIQTSAGIEPGDFQQIFKEIRQELKRKGKNLVLFVEDITSFTGVNQALLNALVTGHTGSNAVDNLCKLISVVGTTTQYYNQFRDNYRDRITKQITIHDGVIGENKNDLVQFVAKYLNAISLSSDALDEWVKNGAYSEDMPVHEDKDHDHWDKFKLASGKQISLFPFTQNAIINLYDAMSDHKTPRYILRDIVEPAVNEALYDVSLFPKFCLGWRSALPESVENRIGNIVQSSQIPQEQKADYRKRLVAFMSFWTNKTLDVTSNGCIAGINTKIFFELDFGEFVSKLTSTATVKEVATSNSVPIKASTSQTYETGNYVVIDESKPQVQPLKPVLKEQPKIDPKNQKDYDSFRANVIAWHRDGGNLIRFVPIRDQISNFVYDAINWQQEGIPLDSKNRFKDSVGGRLVGFERQDQALDRCIVIFEDNDETYQLLLCFGKWLYLGNRSWNFPDSASAIYFATSWLQRNKDKFVNAIKNVDNGSSIPAYIKAAMIGKVYKLIINGRIGDAKFNHLGDETFLNVDSSKNGNNEFLSGHSQAWYELHQFIYNEPKTIDAYIASVRYFNLIQGVTINTDNYVLNYPLYQAALKEIRKSGYVLDENDVNDTEKSVKDKREIIELTQKVISKVHKVADEETTLARKTALEVLSFFDNIDIEDELEASDIRDLINDIQVFYQRCYSLGINISIVDELIFKNFKDSASDIAKAMNLLQRDYSEEDDISILYAFSSNPIGVVLPFLEMLRIANKDVDTAYDQMRSEKESLTRKGNWNDSVDPRFKERQDDFNGLLAELKEV